MKGTHMKIHAKANFNNATENTHIIGVFSADGKTKFSTTHDEFDDFLSTLHEQGVFQAKKAQVYFVRALDDASPNLLFAGLGKATECTGESLRSLGALLAKKLESEKISAAALDLSSFLIKGMDKKLNTEAVAQCLAEGALLSAYKFDHYQSEKKPFKLENVFFYSDKKGQNATKNAIAQAEICADSVFIARDLSNEPGSHLTPMELAKRTQQFAKKYHLSCKILDKKTLEKEKMGALLGVGQGSTNPPCLIVLEHKPKGAKKKIALVGKAVTFDSGGISIKPGQGMEDMKHDMSGGADVIAATILAARSKCKNHILCVVPAAENMPDGNAIVPSTVLKTRNGKTIEVQNTDAEGRLILSDALDYAQDTKLDAIVDVATLTGAVVLALSSVAAGLMGNDPATLEKFKKCAEETEERFVELPIFQEYIDDIKSKVADIKNIGGDRGAGSQKAGAFLKEFIKDGNKWIHLDIAGTAWSNGKSPYNPAYGATGHSVRTLAKFAMTL
ncbi:MAG: leucyl aminopeptidase [Oligoflexia bacterium]|nr:leucyl aminopeptidase [Oligoflexia bacterium]